jgi:hypothetical protein
LAIRAVGKEYVMTNEQIITELAMQIYGEEKVMDMIANGIDVPLHTVQGWGSRGFHVKKGSHAIAETRLWKKKKKKQKKQKEGSAEEGAGEQESAINQNRDFYMCKAFLFGGNQVEKAEAKDE